jgi:Ca-activated chloride channel family protein
LPDLFHGDQLVVLARYQGSGQGTIVLDGHVGPYDKQFGYELEFAAQTDEKPFVEELWARRKVGYLLDQIRVNGEQRELVDEVVLLAKHYGITTPYTSYLIMPDAPLQVASADYSAGRMSRRDAPAALAPGGGTAEDDRQEKLADFARKVQDSEGELAKNRGVFQDRVFEELEQPTDGAAGHAEVAGPAAKDAKQRLQQAKQLKGTLDLAYANYRNGQWRENQVQRLGVELAVCTNQLKCEKQLQASAVRRVASRNCMEIGGVWIDESFTAKTPVVSVKAQSDAYFRILERQPQMKDVFQLGNHVVWMTPNGTGLVIDTTDGKDQMSDHEIDQLFARR